MKELSFEEVAKKYEPIIKKQLSSLNIYQNHDEFYQIGLIALWEAYCRFDQTKGKFSSYAMSYVRGRMLTWLRKEVTFSDKHDFSLEEAHEATIKVYPRFFEEETFQLYLQNLSEKEKLWVQEAIVHGKKRNEIAKEQHVSVQTVKSWRKRALKKLKENALTLTDC